MWNMWLNKVFSERLYEFVKEINKKMLESLKQSITEWLEFVGNSKSKKILMTEQKRPEWLYSKCSCIEDKN